jgi:signal transduction histidine kinase
VLLDVVMETPDAGLQLVRQIRGELGRLALRIVLRTGQPGYAPEIETLRDYDINDYRAKSELTRVRLFSSLAVAIRSYAQLSLLLQQRDELAVLNAELQRSHAAQRAAEAALRETRESIEHCVEQRTQELSRTVNELDAFNRMVSHDLSGPLHGLAGLSAMIRKQLDGGDPGTVKRWVGMMETQTRRLAELVGDLLSLARVSKGDLQRQRVPLGAVVQEALQGLNMGGGSLPMPEVHIGVMPEVSCDASLLRQVFVNLIGNAIKFSRSVPAPRIEVMAVRSADDWLISVRDNGVGFDNTLATGLFKPFARLHGPGFEGTGIGLSIVRRIVERHGGSVGAEGNPGAGARFHFTLPALP